MAQETNNKISNFSDYYDSLDLLARRDFRKEICISMELEYPMFMRKLRADSWNSVERAAIQQIIQRSHEKRY